MSQLIIEVYHIVALNMFSKPDCELVPNFDSEEFKQDMEQGLINTIESSIYDK